MSGKDRFDFHIGTGTFSQAWLPFMEETELNLTDGVGPLFNGYSCVSCHQGAGRSHPVERIDMVRASRGFLPPTPKGIAVLSGLQDDQGNQVQHPDFGIQIQDVAIDGYQPEALIEFRWNYHDFVFPDGSIQEMRTPAHVLIDRIADPVDGEVFSQRTSPPLSGLGLLEALTDESILSQEDPYDLDGDGISGVARRMEDGRIGRFGWKGGAATILDRIYAALWVDMGLSSEARSDPLGDCVTGVSCVAGDIDLDEIEASPFVPHAMADYVAGLAPPPLGDITDPDVVLGGAIFRELNCNSCHTPDWLTGVVPGKPHLSNLWIWPYTDMLLHDMGPGLADNYIEGNASGSEWRTAPLWGIGRTADVEGFESYLHDGRARSLTEAILWHDGEARAARDGFSQITAEDRAKLLEYLKSL
jgi:CxxC motif-containing protein (DUF1111 family)